MSDLDKNKLILWLPLLINAGALIWGAATLSNDLKHLTTLVAQVQSTTVSRAEFEGRIGLLDERDRAHDLRIAEIINRKKEK